MWVLTPVNGRNSVRHMLRDMRHSIPDYTLASVGVAVNEATHDSFVLWRASGRPKLPMLRQHPTSNKEFEHYGVTRCVWDAGFTLAATGMGADLCDALG